MVIAVIALCYLPYLSVGTGVFGFLTTGYLQEEGLVSGDTGLAVGGLAHAVRRHARRLDGLLRRCLAHCRGDGAARVHPRAALGCNNPCRHQQAVTHGPVADLAELSLVFSGADAVRRAQRRRCRCGPSSIGALLLQEEVGWDYCVPLLIRKSVLYGAFIAACAVPLWQAGNASDDPRRARQTNGKQPV